MEESHPDWAPTLDPVTLKSKSQSKTGMSADNVDVVHPREGAKMNKTA